MFASASWMSLSNASQYQRRNHFCATRFRVRHFFKFATSAFFFSTTSIHVLTHSRATFAVILATWLRMIRFACASFSCSARHANSAVATTRRSPRARIASATRVARHVALAASASARHALNADARRAFATLKHRDLNFLNRAASSRQDANARASVARDIRAITRDAIIR